MIRRLARKSLPDGRTRNGSELSERYQKIRSELTTVSNWEERTQLDGVFSVRFLNVDDDLSWIPILGRNRLFFGGVSLNIVVRTWPLKDLDAPESFLFIDRGKLNIGLSQFGHRRVKQD